MDEGAGIDAAQFLRLALRELLSIEQLDDFRSEQGLELPDVEVRIA